MAISGIAPEGILHIVVESQQSETDPHSSPLMRIHSTGDATYETWGKLSALTTLGAINRQQSETISQSSPLIRTHLREMDGKK